jgi:hypothetical protein
LKESVGKALEGVAKKVAEDAKAAFEPEPLFKSLARRPSVCFDWREGK